MATSVYTLSPMILLEHLSDPLRQQALRLAAREFCRRTSAWRETVLVSPASGDRSALIELPGSVDGIILKVVSVWIDDGSSSDKNLSSRRFGYSPDGTLTWDYYHPKPGDVMSASVAVLPSITCSDYPDGLITRWATAIVAKALLDLYKQAGKPWAKGQDARLRRDEAEADYEREVRRAAWGTGGKSRRYFSMRPAPTATAQLPGAWDAQAVYSDPKEN